MPTAVVEKFGNDWTKPENIVGNGAYVLADNSPGERVTLSAIQSYWDDAHTVLQHGQLHHHQRREAGRDPLPGRRTRPDRHSGRPVPDAEGSNARTRRTAGAADSAPTISSSTERRPVPIALKDAGVREALTSRSIATSSSTTSLQAGQTPAYYFTPPATAGFKAPRISTIADVTAGRSRCQGQGADGDSRLRPGQAAVRFTYIYNPSSRAQAIGTAISQMLKEKLGIDMSYSDRSSRRCSPIATPATSRWHVTPGAPTTTRPRPS